LSIFDFKFKLYYFRDSGYYYIYNYNLVITTMADEQESRLFISPIAEPLASDKLSKKLIKLIKKGMKDKLVRRGVKETVKAIRKNNKG